MPETSLPHLLLDGYGAFRARRFPGEAERYRQLAAAGQAPEAMVIACCDSRVAPDIIFNAGPGEIFVYRNVANLVPPFRAPGGCGSFAAALEFAVAGLHIGHILVLGHGDCGGCRAALEPPPTPLSPNDSVGGWVAHLAPAVQEIRANPEVPPQDRRRALEELSVRRSLDNLRAYPCLAQAVPERRPALHGAWFDPASGELSVLNPADGRFTTLA